MTESSDLRDLFNLRKLEDQISGQIVTLATAFQSSSSSSSSSSSTTRTLVEIFRDDEVVYPRNLAVDERHTDNHPIFSWKSIKDHLHHPRRNPPSVSPYMLQPSTEEDAPARISLMALLNRSKKENPSELNVTPNIVGDETEKESEIYLCCVCMVRQKGAAFIPCGHTFCRLCSRELWISRGMCPLCNVYILEVLDIF
ncbi:hypothetical protein ZOSMA_29G00540 [Zostera marina]|uniref:RING-type domain-containing protein n=1 Tax=Zostera marina TaxID=29655 RepID=A0A0K9PDU7_ZOSMR|nr:hypothetical protein ZOSMA_29G00540 [Zostera marina]